MATPAPVYNNMQHQSFGIASWNMGNLNYYLVPGIMCGIAVVLFIVLVFLMAFCQLMQV